MSHKTVMVISVAASGTNTLKRKMAGWNRENNVSHVGVFVDGICVYVCVLCVCVCVVERESVCRLCVWCVYVCVFVRLLYDASQL